MKNRETRALDTFKRTGDLGAKPFAVSAKGQSSVLFRGALIVAALFLLALPVTLQAQFTFITNNGAITITGYTGSGGAVVIPDTTNGFPVTVIGSQAFYNCSNLTSVTIPNSATGIGIQTFGNCSSLTNVTIGNSVVSIGTQAFSGSTSLISIIVDTSNAWYCSMDGVLFNKNQTVILAFPGGLSGSYTIPNSVTSIGANAFNYCTNLTSVTIPISVTNIGNFAFSACISLASANIPNGVSTIGSYAFSSCYGLTNVTIGTSVTNIGNYAFQACGLTSLTIPNSVIGIGVSAFAYCFSLTNVTIGNSVTTIGYHAFYYCQNLTSSLTIPGSVTSIGSYAFQYCDLFAVYFQGNAPPDDGTAFSGNIWATVYYLPGTKGWGAKFGSLSALLWNPQAQTRDGNFGVRTNRFGFNITGTKNIPIVVEASTNLANPVWIPITTNGLFNGTNYFSDPQWTNYPGRFYRIRSP